LLDASIWDIYLIQANFVSNVVAMATRVCRR